MSTQSFRYGKYLGLSDLLLDVLIIEELLMSASRPETFDKLFMASVRASVAFPVPASISLRRTGFWSSNSGK